MDTDAARRSTPLAALIGRATDDTLDEFLEHVDAFDAVPVGEGTGSADPTRPTYDDKLVAAENALRHLDDDQVADLEDEFAEQIAAATRVPPSLADTDVGSLTLRHLDVRPRRHTWDNDAYGDEWDFYDVGTADDGAAVRSWEPDEVERHHMEGALAGPVGNFVYEVDVDTDLQDAAMRLEGLPVCVIEIDDADGMTEVGMALTGGGMDLSWEIAEAYMRLGHLPPAHFAELPAMAGMPASDDNLKIVEACERSLTESARTAERRREWGVETLDRIRANLSPVNADEPSMTDASEPTL